MTDTKMQIGKYMHLKKKQTKKPKNHQHGRSLNPKRDRTNFLLKAYLPPSLRWIQRFCWITLRWLKWVERNSSSYICYFTSVYCFSKTSTIVLRLFSGLCILKMSLQDWTRCREETQDWLKCGVNALWWDNAWAWINSFIDKMIEKWLDYNV